MKAHKLSPSICLLLLAGLGACQIDGDSRVINCTEEFRSVGVKVSGEPLTDFYTIRLSTSDTIRARQEFTPVNNWYWILDDSYQKLLAKRRETFKFIGKRGNAIVVEELYMIEADECHINKVSGKDEI